ncbi:MAG: hypothetical protein ACKV2T_25640, partial [Kofleriaceae bacterium]
GKFELRYRDRALFKDGKERFVFDLATKTSTPLVAAGDFQGLDGSLVKLGNDVFDLVSVKRVDLSGASVLGHTNGRILVGTDAPLDCSKDPPGLPYSCGNPAAGGSMGMPFGPPPLDALRRSEDQAQLRR